MNDMTKDAIGPGAQVRCTDGVVGMVERIEHESAGESDTVSAIVVRCGDDLRLYRVPATELGRVEGAGHTGIIHLRTARGNLAPYRLSEQEADAVGMAGRAGQADSTSSQQTAGPTMRASGRASQADLTDLTAADGTLRLPLAAEEITVEKQPRRLGRVHVHKGIRTVEETLTIPVDHEETIIEHLSPDQYDGTAPADPNEIIIPVVEERLVVEKRPVVVEYIRVRKNVVTEEREVTEAVRKVYVEVTQEPEDGVDVEAAPLFRDVTTGMPSAGR